MLGHICNKSGPAYPVEVDNDATTVHSSFKDKKEQNMKEEENLFKQTCNTN